MLNECFVLCFVLAGTAAQEKKPRGRPPRGLTTQRTAASLSPHSSLPSPTQAKLEGPELPSEKEKRLPGRPPGTGEKRRGRPPSSSNKKAWSSGNHAADEDSRLAESELGLDTEGEKDKKAAKKPPAGSVQPHDMEARLSKAGRSEPKVNKLKRLTETKMTPLNPHLKTVPGVPRRRPGRPPSAERLKAMTAAAQLCTLVEGGEGKHKAFRVRGGDSSTDQLASQQAILKNVDGSDDQVPSSAAASPPPSKLGKPVGLRKSPRHVKPVRIVPPSKRTDATIAKQLLQRAKKGAQKRLEKEAVATGGSVVSSSEAGIRKTQLKNIRQFIMPVVSTVSLRIIKTPKRFIEDEGSFGTSTPLAKMPRLETPTSALSTSAQTTSATSSSPSPALVSVTVATASSGMTAPIVSPPHTASPEPIHAVPSAAPSLLNSSSNTANGRFSSSAPSCGSSAVSQHSSQLSSAESSRSSSPSLDDSSCDSQASEATQTLSDQEDNSPSSHGERESSLLQGSQPLSPPSETEPEHVLSDRSRRGRRAQGAGRGSHKQRVKERLTTRVKKPIISPPTGLLMPSSTIGNSQQASSTASSPSSPPPPPSSLLTLTQPPQSSSSSAAAISEHLSQPSWMPHPIPPFLPGSPVLSSLSDKRNRSILREPTFRWTSMSNPKLPCFSSAKYAKEGLIRKPIFDNFRPPPLTLEDVGLLPQGVLGAGGATAGAFRLPGAGAGTGTRLFGPLHAHHQHPSSTRFDAPHAKRSPLLRAPCFTPSEAHSRIFESVTLPSSSGSSPGSLSPHQNSSSSAQNLRPRRRPVSVAQRSNPRSPSHSMTRRSSQMGGHVSVGKVTSEMSVLSSSVSSGNPSSLSSSLATSALVPAPFSTFSSVSLSLPAQGTPESRRGANGTPSLSTPPAAPSPLFSAFPSSAQDTGRGAGKGGKEKAPPEPATKEKENDFEKNREKEKENKRDGRKDFEKRNKTIALDDSPNPPSSLFGVDKRDSEGGVLHLSPKKTPGRKKSTSVDTISDTASSDGRGLHHSSIGKGRPPKKGRLSEKVAETENVEKDKEKRSMPNQQTPSLPGQPSGKHQLPVSLLVKQTEQHPLPDKRIVGLLKKAKDQLIAIKKNKQKPAEQNKVQVSSADFLDLKLHCFVLFSLLTFYKLHSSNIKLVFYTFIKV